MFSWCLEHLCLQGLRLLLSQCILSQLQYLENIPKYSVQLPASVLYIIHTKMSTPIQKYLPLGVERDVPASAR